MPHREKKRFKKKASSSSLHLTRKKRKRLRLKSKWKNRQLILKNLPYQATEKELQEYLSKFGEIKKIKLPRKADGNLIGHGVILFSEENDAAQAKKNCSGKDFMGRKIILDWAVQKAKNENNLDVKDEPDEVVVKKEESETESEDHEKTEHNTEFKNRKRKQASHSKEMRKAKNARKGRLIVRNLPFQITEDKLLKHFKKYGDISEVKLLRKGDGQMVGCGFLQFTNRNCAAKAILSCSGKPLQGRTIIVDWAVPKVAYDENSQANSKEEIEDDPESAFDDKSEIKVKEEPLSDASGDDDDDDDDDDEAGDGEDDDDDDEGSDGDMAESDDESKVQIKKPRVISNDVTEGRTVFIKNVPFSATNEDLKTCMEQFGRVIYALICTDPDTEHSKGTAFVKFQKKESADECLSAGTELVLHDEILDVYEALKKEDLEKKAADKNQKMTKDNRNLYLVKEGVVLAGSKAAADVSMSDMDKRLKLERWKTQMLRNLNMYVSPERLVVQNLPPLYTDAKLRQLFAKHAGPKAVIKEARVMRDMKNLDAQGVGQSKEFGFVRFTSHEHALEALRNINNNPKIFSAAKRPIVAFSIENRAIMNIKEKRLEKSRTRNPLYSNNSNSKLVSNRKGKNKQMKNVKAKEESEGERKPYAGVTSKPGKTKMRSRFRLDTQAKVHSETVQKAKRKQKKQRKIEMQKQVTKEKMKDSQPSKGAKKKKKDDDTTFSNLVNKYKQNLMTSSNLVDEYKKKIITTKGKKWYDA